MDGEILFRARLSEILFRGVAPWVRWLPGRLMHVNVVGCGIFAAVCGSSAATVATIGRMSLPELRQQGYDQNLSIGSLAGSGTLGLLIPPSIIMIVYGVAADVSIVRLFWPGVSRSHADRLVLGYIGLSAIFRTGSVPFDDLKSVFGKNCGAPRD